MTGVSDSNAKTPNSSVDRSENASDELAIVFNVCPAWIARNEGGATPANTKFIEKIPLEFGFNVCPEEPEWLRSVWLSQPLNFGHFWLLWLKVMHLYKIIYTVTVGIVPN